MGNWISQQFTLTGDQKQIEKFHKKISKFYWEHPLILTQHKDYFETHGRTKNTIFWEEFLEISKKCPDIKIRIVYDEIGLQICGVIEIQNGTGLVVHGRLEPTKEPWVFRNQYKNHIFDGTEDTLKTSDHEL